MAAIDLGDVEDFPFLDPPDRRQVRDGIALLQELGALDETGRKLTPLGRKLAQLPVDPRMGRMVLEADRLGCADEVIVIAAALSIQDVRERPADQQAQADQAHARHADESSDFLAYLNLWRYLHERRGELSVNQFRKQAKGEFLHYLRIREWQDLVGQLRQAAKQVGIKINHTPAEPEAIHQAILTGLLSHLGLRDAGPARLPRRARRALRALAGQRRQGPAELGDGLRAGRDRRGCGAGRRRKIDPRWVEPLAEHLLRRTYDEPRWDRRSAPRSSPPSASRSTGCRSSPAARSPTASSTRSSRATCSSAARWSRASGTRATASSPPTSSWSRRSRRSRSARAGATSSSTTRRSTTSTPRAIPETIVSGAHFDRWWRDERRVAPGPADVHARAADQPGGGRGRRAAARTPGCRARLELKLTYRFEPGTRARRRDRPRAAEDRSRSCAPRASSGSCPRCAPSSSPR